MFHLKTPKGLSKTELYKFLEEQAQALITGELDFIANSANLCSLLWHCLPDINWVGVYRLKPEGLVLGPFQGKPARTRIPLGQGVCGTVAKENRSILVADVEKFPGHIVCDPASRSELVVPLRVCEELVIGVLDLDSPVENRFDLVDQEAMETLASILTRRVSSLLKGDL
ncbi:MAG: GAF domain-containing protein [Limisphaerales bacterium]|jgi:L-methionine (R)-S-oxide reductase